VWNSERKVLYVVRGHEGRGFLPKDTLFFTTLDPLSGGEQLRRCTAREDGDVVRRSGIKIYDFLSKLCKRL
jgi:hypothetical protein